MEGRPARAGSLFPEPGRTVTLNGGFVAMDGEQYYRITSFQCLEPFLMSLPTNTDLWMFIASGGGLAAGRVDAEGSLFPYLTVDQLHDAHHHSGPLTLIRVEQTTGDPALWQPFAEDNAENPRIERNLYKNATGNRLVFEERNQDLGLVFRYSWCGCDEFGWVRSASLENRRDTPCQVSVLDGLRNVLPWGAPVALYQQSSTLIDAYKKTEVDPETGLGLFSLTAGITDRAEALEVLKANVVWCCGLQDFKVHLSLDAIASFRHGRVLADERLLNGQRGNYLVSSSLDLVPAQTAAWHLVADVGRDHLQIAALRRRLLQEADLKERIDVRLNRAVENLRRNVASADGLQTSGKDTSDWHHFANVLFNNMRGGVFAHNYDLPVADLVDFLQLRNAAVAARHEGLLAGLAAEITLDDLMTAARAAGDPDFERLCYEYLPLHFGRRHGDPSRPWNKFSIRVRNRDGERALNYEGNWRDIFQNWEALGASFPGFLPSMVAKFVNASTVDGFNPYRITREGVDWEAPDPDNPWSHIGYWGDHQIIYLLKLLEAMAGFDPAATGAMLGVEIFSYAEVPYRIKPYADLLRDPGNTIVFDDERHDRIEQRVKDRGTDGKLLTGPDGGVYHANLFEKLLVPALAKLSNLVPDAGIWMNTQRPEWNDANNALAGGGISVVTLCYLRRYLAFLADLYEQAPDNELPVSNEVAAWFGRIATTLQSEGNLPADGKTDAESRKRMMDALGTAFADYRAQVYDHGFSGKTAMSTHEAAGVFRTALELIDRSIRANQREDGLFHTYNILEITPAGAEVQRLQEMLEGQVAALSAGVLDPGEALAVLDQLFDSAIYRPEQRSFMLYPERQLPGFLAKNRVPAEAAEAIPLLRDLLKDGDGSLVARDADGVVRFHGDFQCAADVQAALDELGAHENQSEAVDRDRSAILELFEHVFGHESYTGRSGVMYGYEGLGCIYWHMVAKLLLAVQENFLQAERAGLAPDLREKLARMYFRVRAGIGYEKTAAEYGAFPTDPYSHTPPAGGAKQPGMTGQVKEEILTRLGELGVRVKDGAVSFQPTLLHAAEFLGEPRDFHYFDVAGAARTVALAPGSLAFTLCQVPVVYERVAAEPAITVEFNDGTSHRHQGVAIDVQVSSDLFARTGRIDRIRVGVPADNIGAP